MVHLEKNKAVKQQYHQYPTSQMNKDQQMIVFMHSDISAGEIYDL